MRRKTVSILLLNVILFSNIIGINSITNNFRQTLPVGYIANAEDKIDPVLAEMIENNGGISSYTDEFVEKVIIILYDEFDTKDFPCPDYLEITDTYTIINGFLAYIQINKVNILANYPQVRGIWLDQTYNSIPTAEQTEELINFIETSSGSNEGYTNYTGEIGAQDLWDKGINGSGVIIAVLDSGIDLTGQLGGDLDDFDDVEETADLKYAGAVSLVPEEPLYYTDFNGRGTYYTGIACGTGYLANASDPTNTSYTGVAPGASFMNVKVYDSLGLTYWSFLISGVEWSIQHSADILLFCTAILGTYIDPISLAITNAVKKGLVVVSPTGDEGPSYMSVTTPGDALGAISVGAYDVVSGEVANFSSRGPGYDFRVVPDLVAPGVDLVGPRSRIFTNDSLSMVNTITSSLSENAGLLGELLGGDFDDLGDMMSFDSISLPDNLFPRPSYGTPINENYTKASSTGGAAAIVAGAAALLIQAFPLANPQLIATALTETAISINGDLNTEGKGKLNVSAAYDYLYKYFGENDYVRIPFSVPLPYAGVITTTNSSAWNQTALGTSLEFENINAYDLTSLFSTQALMDALIVTNGTSNDTLDFAQIHLPLNQFGLYYDGRNHWLSEFQVVRELSQMTTINMGDEDYNRYLGILELNGLYVSLIVESWNYIADYIEIGENRIFYEYKDRVNGYKINLRFLNLREDQKDIEDFRLISYFKADLYANETGVLNAENVEGITDILEIGLDDNITFDPMTQTICVSDYNNNTDFAYDDKYSVMGFNSTSTQLAGYRIDDSIDLIGNLTISGLLDLDEIPENYFDNSSHYERGIDDPGYAMVYNIDDSLEYGSWGNFSSLYSLGIGETLEDANNTLYEQFDYIQNKVTNYEVRDIVVVEADFNRMHFTDEAYESTVLIFNLGNTEVNNTQIGFAANRITRNEEIETFSLIKTIEEFALDEYYEVTITWTPQDEGVYLAGWAVIDISSNYYEIYSEDNLLNNILARSVYVVDKEFYESITIETFRCYPDKLDQNPFKIHYPGDFALFNISTNAIMDIPDVTVTLDGSGSQYMIMTWFGPDIMSLLNSSADQSESQGDEEDLSEMDLDMFNFDTTLTTDVLHPLDMIFVVGYGPLLCPQGVVKFNITFSSPSMGGVFYQLPVEIEFQEYRGRVFFDGIHNFIMMDSNLELLTGEGTISEIDLENFIDLEERFDYTFADYSDLTEIWANSNEKGVAVQNMLPGINLNVTDFAGGLIEAQEQAMAEEEGDEGDSSGLGIEMDMEIQFDMSMLEDYLGGYTFEGDNLTTNTINTNIIQLFDVLVITDPEIGFNESEIEDIVDWVEAGGALFVWCENKTENRVDSLNELLVEFNLTVSEDSDDMGGEQAISSTSWNNPGDIFEEYAIGTLVFDDPVFVDIIESTSDGADKVEKLCPYIAVAEKGEGRVCVVGDKDMFTTEGLQKGNNTQFAQKLIAFGLNTYFEITVTPKTTQLKQYTFNTFNAQIENYETDEDIQNYVDDGVLFLCGFMYEDSTVVNISIYGFELPLFVMLETENGGYGTSYSANWFNKTGTYYAAFLIDDPAAAQEMFYVEFEVIAAPEPPEVTYYDFGSPEYPHWIDILGIIWIVMMGIIVWMYNIEKWKTRFRIVQIKGSVLNQAKTKINEGESLLKQILSGVAHTEDEQERIRLFLSYRKRLGKYLKDLKKFGEDIGEHY